MQPPGSGGTAIGIGGSPLLRNQDADLDAERASRPSNRQRDASPLDETSHEFDPLAGRRTTHHLRPMAQRREAMARCNATPLRDKMEKTMRRVRAFVYGAGAMGQLATRLMLEKGVDVVGAAARSADKVGRDLGDLAGVGRSLGVEVSGNASEAISRTRPDIVMLATQSFIPEIFDQVAECTRLGANVITISEESLFPWSSSPQQAAELDALAKANGVTITGSGHQDVFWLNMVSMLMGASHRIEEVHGRASWNADEYGADVIASKHVGETLAEFEVSTSSETRPPGYGRNVLGALALRAGLTPLMWESSINPIVTQEPRESMSLGRTLSPGTVVGYGDVDTLETVEGPVSHSRWKGTSMPPEPATSTNGA